MISKKQAAGKQSSAGSLVLFYSTNTHLIGQDSRDTILKETSKPTHTFQLIVLEIAPVGEIVGLHKNRFTPRSNDRVLD